MADVLRASEVQLRQILDAAIRASHVGYLSKVRTGLAAVGYLTNFQRRASINIEIDETQTLSPTREDLSGRSETVQAAAGTQESEVVSVRKSIIAVLEDDDLINVQASANETDLFILLRQMRKFPTLRDDVLKRLAEREPARMGVARASRIVDVLDAQLDVMPRVRQGIHGRP